MKSAVLLLALLVPAAALDAERPALRFTSPLGVDLSSLQLESAQPRFGTAPITSKGKYQEQVCYLWPNALVTYSSSDKFWMAFELSEVPETVPPDCVKVNAIDAELPLSVERLHLGMKEEEFVTTVGGQPEWEEGQLIVRFEWKEDVNVPPPGSGVATLIAGVRIEGVFSNRRLAAFRIVYRAST